MKSTSFRSDEELVRIKEDFELACDAVGVDHDERLMFRYFGRVMSNIVASESSWRRVFKEGQDRPEHNIKLLLHKGNQEKLNRLLADETEFKKTLLDIQARQAAADQDPWSGIWYEVRIGEDLDHHDVRKLFVSSAMIFAPAARSQKIEMVRSTAVWGGQRTVWNNHLQVAMERHSREPGEGNRWTYYAMTHPKSRNAYCLGLTLGVRGTSRSHAGAFATRVVWMRRPDLVDQDGDSQAWWEELKLDEPRQKQLAIHRTFDGDKVQKRTEGGFEDEDFSSGLLDAAVNALLGNDFVGPPPDYSDWRARLLEVGGIRGDWPFRAE